VYCVLCIVYCVLCIVYCVLCIVLFILLLFISYFIYLLLSYRYEKLLSRAPSSDTDTRLTKLLLYSAEGGFLSYTVVEKCFKDNKFLFNALHYQLNATVVEFKLLGMTVIVLSNNCLPSLQRILLAYYLHSVQ
jgi:hypothetical protein